MPFWNRPTAGQPRNLETCSWNDGWHHWGCRNQDARADIGIHSGIDARIDPYIDVGIDANVWIDARIGIRRLHAIARVVDVSATTPATSIVTAATVVALTVAIAALAAMVVAAVSPAMSCLSIGDSEDQSERHRDDSQGQSFTKHFKTPVE